MKDATGIWIYRVAFLGAACIVLGLLRFIVFARATWFPAYEEKMQAQMRQYASPFAPAAENRAAKKSVKRKKTMASKSRRTEVKQ